MELMKMKTLERRAKMSELQRLRNAQVSVAITLFQTLIRRGICPRFRIFVGCFS